MLRQDGGRARALARRPVSIGHDEAAVLQDGDGRVVQPVRYDGAGGVHLQRGTGAGAAAVEALHENGGSRAAARERLGVGDDEAAILQTGRRRVRSVGELDEPMTKLPPTASPFAV